MGPVMSSAVAPAYTTTTTRRSNTVTACIDRPTGCNDRSLTYPANAQSPSAEERCWPGSSYRERTSVGEAAHRVPTAPPPMPEFPAARACPAAPQARTSSAPAKVASTGIRRGSRSSRRAGAGVQVGGRRCTVRPRGASPAERQLPWRQMARVSQRYEEYARRTDRDIPIVLRARRDCPRLKDREGPDGLAG
ncbi:nitroreductase/quinone reductase family protein [Streptomyces spinosirectus]